MLDKGMRTVEENSVKIYFHVFNTKKIWLPANGANGKCQLFEDVTS